MTIIPFPIPNPPQPPARRPRYVQCTLGQQLQAAREQAGLTREQLAHRMHLAGVRIERILGGYACPEDRKDPFFEFGRCSHYPTCEVMEGYDAQNLKRFERMSQHVFDKRDAERKAKGWESLSTFYTGYLRVIELAHPEAGDDEFLAAVRTELVRITHEAADDAERARYERLAGSIVRLVWNSDGRDLNFLDQALCAEFHGLNLEDLEGVARFALDDLAIELHRAFPNRPLMDLEAWKDAA